MANEPDIEEPISITLPAKAWLTVLAAVDEMNQAAMAGIQNLKDKGIDPATLSPEDVHALTGPMLVRGTIVKEMVARGHMTAEADEQFGIDGIVAAVTKKT